MTTPTNNPAAQPDPGATERIDADAAGEWCDWLGECWLENNPMRTLGKESPPDLVRRTILETIPAIAQAMADNPPRGNNNANTDPTQIAQWLKTWGQASAQPQPWTEKARLMSPLQDNAEPTKPLERRLSSWTATLRETALDQDIQWVRGNHDGPLRLDVTEHEQVWTVTEHGNADTQHELTERAIEAAAEALAGLKSMRGETGITATRLVKSLHDDMAKYCEQKV